MTVKVGIIGCGGIANGKHMPALSQVEEVEMVAFCDLLVERAVEAKSAFGTEDAQVFSDYQEMLAQADLDVIDFDHDRFIRRPTESRLFLYRTNR